MAENFNENLNTSFSSDASKPRKIKKLIKRPIVRPLSPDAPNLRLRKIKKLVRPIGNNAPLPPDRFSAPTERPENRTNFDFSSSSSEDFSPISDSQINDLLDNQTSENPALPSTDIATPPFSAETPQFINESDLQEPQKKLLFSDLKVGELFTKKAMIFAAVGMLICGLIFGKLFFANSTVVRSGLSGVIANPEVPKGRARCGVAEKTQGCVLYIMNPQRQDLYARDFYDLASQLTGRQRFIIETGNMRYSNVRLAPGEIGQFNIPPLQ